MPDAGLLRKRVKAAIERARATAAARRERATEATHRYEALLEKVATPAFRAVANVLRAEGIPFDVQTPLGAVRLVSDRRRDEDIELSLDDSLDPPHPVLVSNQARGSRSVRTEHTLKEGARLETIDEEDVIDALLARLAPWLE